MPHTPSAKKRWRQNEKRRLRNRIALKAIKTQWKRVAEAAESGDLDKLRLECRLAAKKVDKAAQQRVVHPNLAARKKAQLGRLLHVTTQSAKK
jgi:small subunit ribosomal protein S20